MNTDELNTTFDLLAKLRAGVDGAEDRLVERCLPPLRRWARGRLPRFARSVCDTQDLVHDAIVRTLPRLHSFDSRGRGALLGFLRRSVHNHVIDEVRKAQRRPAAETPLEARPDSAPSPLQQAILRQGMDRYRATLATLSASDQDMIRARFEDQRSYDEIAEMTGKPSANASRVAASRALARLLKAMARGVRRARLPRASAGHHAGSLFVHPETLPACHERDQQQTRREGCTSCTHKHAPLD